MRQLQVVLEILGNQVLMLTKETLINFSFRLVTKPSVVIRIINDTSFTTPTVEFFLAGRPFLRTST